MQIAEKVEKRVDRVYVFLRRYLDRWTFLETFRKIFAETKTEDLRIDDDLEGNPRYLLPEIEFALYLRSIQTGCGFDYLIEVFWEKYGFDKAREARANIRVTASGMLYFEFGKTVDILSVRRNI